MLYQINVASQHYVFEDLKTLLAKATPERSGDQLAGIAAVDATERVAAPAQMCLAEVPLRRASFCKKQWFLMKMMKSPA